MRLIAERTICRSSDDRCTEPPEWPRITYVNDRSVPLHWSWVDAHETYRHGETAKLVKVEGDVATYRCFRLWWRRSWWGPHARCVIVDYRRLGDRLEVCGLLLQPRGHRL